MQSLETTKMADDQQNQIKNFEVWILSMILTEIFLKIDSCNKKCVQELENALEQPISNACSQCGQNIMGPKHHLKAQKHQPKTPPKNLKKHHFQGKKHHIFFKNLSKMTLPWIFIAFLCINFWKIFTVKLKFSKNF